MRGQAFKGNPASMSLLQPFITPKHPQTEGIPLGFELRTGKIVMFYPWTLPTHSTTCQIEGMKNSGKSAFMKMLMARMLCLQAVDAYGQPTLMRGRINSRKSEQGIAEFAPLADALATPIYDLAESGSINLFGLFNSEADIIEVALNIIEEVAQEKPRPQVSLAVMVAVRRILQARERVISPPLLEAMLRTLTLEDFKQYHESNRASLRLQFKDAFAGNAQLLEQLSLDKPIHEVDQTYLYEARVAADCLSQLVNGNFGRAFGGSNSLYDVLSQQVVALNWENLPSNAQTILESVLLKAETSAIVQAKRSLGHNQDLSNIIPHINLSDEEGGAMKSLMHARFMAEKQNKSRAYPTLDIRAVQYYSQVTKAGNEGSELRELAEEIENGVGFRIIFKQPSDTDFLERFSRLGMSESDVALLPQLETGQAMLWIRDHPPLLFQTVLTPTELPLVQSNSARAAMATTLPIWNSKEYRKQASTEGTISPFEVLERQSS